MTHQTDWPDNLAVYQIAVDTSADTSMQSGMSESATNLFTFQSGGFLLENKVIARWETYMGDSENREQIVQI